MRTEFTVGHHNPHLRTCHPGDYAFQLGLYSDTRAEELAQVQWSDAQKAAFLAMQFDAQSNHYQVHFPEAIHYIIELDEKRIGRLILDYQPDTILIVDIALLSQYRYQEIGSTLLLEIMAEAERLVKSVTLRVEFFNPAYRLYERMGFSKTRDLGVYHEMVWNGQTQPAGDIFTELMHG
jgi:ribosomal protein S18 acetylase RimI-like enzyme